MRFKAEKEWLPTQSMANNSFAMTPIQKQDRNFSFLRSYRANSMAEISEEPRPMDSPAHSEHSNDAKPEQKSMLIKALPRLDESEFHDVNQSSVIYVLPDVESSMIVDRDPLIVVEMAKCFDKKRKAEQTRKTVDDIGMESHRPYRMPAQRESLGFASDEDVEIVMEER